MSKIKATKYIGRVKDTNFIEINDSIDRIGFYIENSEVCYIDEDGFSGSFNVTSLANPLTINYIGDVTGTVTFDGSEGSLSSTLTINSPTYGKSLLNSNNASAARATLGLGNISLQNSNNVDITGGTITGIGLPVSDNDIATKIYVDGLIQSLSVKPPVVVATTTNISLSGLQTVDGISLSTGDRVLVKDQTTASQNGIYAVSSGSWTRTSDANTGTKLNSGSYVFVTQGTTNADTSFVLETDGIITIGTTNLSFVQFSGLGQITAGNGLTKTGNTLNVVGTTNRISVSADSIDISSSYVGQTSITTLGSITTGTWNATPLDFSGLYIINKTANNVVNTPSGDITSTNVQSTINEVGSYIKEINIKLALGI